MSLIPTTCVFKEFGNNTNWITVLAFRDCLHRKSQNILTYDIYEVFYSEFAIWYRLRIANPYTIIQSGKGCNDVSEFQQWQFKIGDFVNRCESRMMKAEFWYEDNETQ